MLGFSRVFSIVVFIAIVFSLGLRDYRIGIKIIGVAAVMIILWKVLRKK